MSLPGTPRNPRTPRRVVISSGIGESRASPPPSLRERPLEDPTSVLAATPQPAAASIQPSSQIRSSAAPTPSSTTKAAMPPPSVATATTWSSSEHSKCLEALDALVHNARRLHDDDAASPTRKDVGGGDAPSSSVFKKQEDHELHLISTALHSKDIVGIFSLLTVFWSTRNHLLRDVEALQHRLGGRSAHETQHADDAAPQSFSEALGDAHRRIEDMLQHLASSADVNKNMADDAERRAHAGLSDGAHKALLHEREAALRWHQQVLNEGSYVDVIKLSVDLQQEYQRAQRTLHDPFGILLGGPSAHPTSSTQNVQQAGDFEYLDSLSKMVADSLESQSRVKEELAALVEAYDASAHTFSAPPVLRLLGGALLDPPADRWGGQPEGSRTMSAAPASGDHNDGVSPPLDMEVAMRLLPEFDESFVDPLASIGGVTLSYAQNPASPHRHMTRHSADRDATATNRNSAALWRLVRFVPVDASAGETFLSIMQRASKNSATFYGEGSALEQACPRNLFCPMNKRPIVDCPDLWLPPDPRLTTAGGATKQRTIQYSSGTTDAVGGPRLLHAVLKQAMCVVVRVVVPLRSLAPAMKALLSQRCTLDQHTIPKTKKALAELKQALWAAEIESIEQRTSSRRHHHPTTGTDRGGSDDSKNKIQQLKQRIARLEGQEAVCEQALSHCQEHLRALEEGDLAALSAMLTASTAHFTDHNAGIGNDGSYAEDRNEHAWAPERVVYVCKELPRGSSLDEFAASFGVAVDDLHPFDELVIAAGERSASTAGGSAAVAEDERRVVAPATKPTTQRRTLVYVPIRVPIASVVEQDRLLTEELEEHTRTYPSFPPNAEVLEHIAALRRGDINTLSALLCAARAKRKAFDETSRAGALERRVDELQHELAVLLKESDAMKEALRASDALVREKTAALERHAWHRKPQKLDSHLPDGDRKRHPSPHRSAESGSAEVERMSPGDIEWSEWNPDYFMRRGLTPVEALEHVTQVAAKQDATITSLRLMIKKSEDERENANKDTILRLGSSASRLKQVRDLEATVSALKHELKEEGRRGAELTARCVQLEQINESLGKDLAHQKQALSTSNESLSLVREEVVDLKKALREAQSRANTAERDAQQASEAQLLSTTRHTFAAREIPSGMSAAEFLHHLGVHGPAADVSLAKGTVFDALRQLHYVYVPVQVERGRWSVEDERLQSELASASAALHASFDTAVGHAGHLSGGGAHGDILDQLNALRTGDTVTLSAMIRSYRLKLLSAMHEGGGRTLSPISATSDSLREEDDLAWSTVKEGRAKVMFLRSALRAADAERVQWKSLCEEYQAAEVEVQRRVTALDEANRGSAKRVDALQCLLDAREKEVARMKRQLQEAEEAFHSGDQRYDEERRVAQEKHHKDVEELQNAIQTEKAARARDTAFLTEQLNDAQRTVTTLRQALDEMGIEMVMDDA